MTTLMLSSCEGGVEKLMLQTSEKNFYLNNDNSCRCMWYPLISM